MICVVLGTVAYLSDWQVTPGSVGFIITETADWLVRTTIQDPRGAILTSMPALSRMDTPEEMESPGKALTSWLANIARLNMNPRGILVDQIPLLGHIATSSVVIIEESPELQSGEETVLKQELSNEILVGIYNTHTGEAYAMSEGTERVAGKGGVVKVAENIQETLEKKFFLRVARSETVHDLQYATSYLESEKTAREMVAKYPGMIALLDIHRDAGKTREQSIVEVEGKKVAPILLIVGSDARRPFPNWQENYKFACLLAGKMDALYPGLCIGVRVKEGRYNQFLHPGSVLVEMGTVNNTLEEAVTSGEMFVYALASVIEEELKSKRTLVPEENPEATPSNQASLDESEEI